MNPHVINEHGRRVPLLRHLAREWRALLFFIVGFGLAGVGIARGGQNLPPAVGVCAQARVAQRGVDIPANARVVSMGPGEGRPWACWVEGKTP